MQPSLESESIGQIKECENCSFHNLIDRKFCSQCSFPIGGTDEEKRNFNLTVSSRKRLLSDAKEKIKSAKTIIYVLAGLFFLTGVFVGLVNDDFASMIVSLFISLLYLIFAAWSDKNPFAAILTAALVYVTVQVVNAFVDPMTIGSGIFLKIFFIAAFIKGIRSALEAQNFLKELEKLKAVPVGNG
jgi:hypothetical protein